MADAVKSVGVLTTDRALVIRTWDGWLAGATGIEEKSAIGKPLLKLFPEIEARGNAARLQRVVEEGAVEVMAPAFHHYLIECHTPAAAPYFSAMQQHVTISPLRENGAITGLVITIEDVTARCVQERELAAQLKSENDEIRLRAARILSEQSTDPSPLMDILGDENWQVRRAAISGVAEHSDEQIIGRIVHAIEQAHTDIGLLNAALSAVEQARTDAVPALLPLLERSDPNVRMYGALALGNLQDGRAVPRLIALLDDVDTNVRYHAIEALGRIRAYEAVGPLCGIVEMRDAFLAFAAIDALAAIGESSAAPTVAALLPDPLLGSAAVDALAALGSEQDASALARVLRADHIPVGAVCRALARIALRLDQQYGEGQLVADVARAELTVEAGARLIKSIRNASDDDLPHIARVLGWLDFAGVEYALASLLQHPTARHDAQEALIRSGARATTVLVGELAHDDPEVRRAAASALGRIGNHAAVGHLMRMLEDDDGDVVIGVAQALGSIGDHAALEPLIRLLGHHDAAVRGAAVSAINSIGHPDTARYVAELLQQPNANVRECAIRIAGYFGFTESLGAVLALVNDSSETVRRAAVEHLGFFDDERVVPAITSALTGSSGAVRAAAARALAHVPRQYASEPVRAALRDPDPRVRYQAVLAAAAQRLTEDADVLIDLLQHDAAMPVRIAAAEALGELRQPAAAEALTRLVDHQEADLACAAIDAAAGIPGKHVTDMLRRALQSDDARRQITALASMSGGVAPELIADVRQAAESPHAQVARAALEKLAQIGTPESLQAAFSLAVIPARREDVIAALAQASDAHIASVARGLRHPDARVRRVAVEALARMKRTSASRALTFSLNDEDPRVQFATRQALGRLDWMQRPAPGSGAARAALHWSERQSS